MTGAAGRASGSRGKKLFHDSIFQRMKRHHHEPSARMKRAFGRVKCAHELAELVVDGDPQSLKHACGGVNTTRFLPDERRNEIRELLGGCKRLPASRLDHCAGDRSRTAL